MLIMVLLGMYFHAVEIFVTSQTLLFRLALAILCGRSLINSVVIFQVWRCKISYILAQR